MPFAKNTWSSQMFRAKQNSPISDPALSGATTWWALTYPKFAFGKTILFWSLKESSCDWNEMKLWWNKLRRLPTDGKISNITNPCWERKISQHYSPWWRQFSTLLPQTFHTRLTPSQWQNSKITTPLTSGVTRGGQGGNDTQSRKCGMVVSKDQKLTAWFIEWQRAHGTRLLTFLSYVISTQLAAAQDVTRQRKGHHSFSMNVMTN